MSGEEGGENVTIVDVADGDEDDDVDSDVDSDVVADGDA